MCKSEDELSALLVRVSEGNQDAFRDFYKLYYLRLYRYAVFYVKDRRIVEEIVSDVFCSLWEGRRTLLRIEKLNDYLFVVVRNRSLHYLKSGFFEKDHEEPPSNLAVDSDNPELIYIQQEELASIYRAIDALPDRCRTIFLLAKQQRMKYSEIAAHLSISEKTVNAQIVLALKKLKHLLSRTSD